MSDEPDFRLGELHGDKAELQFRQVWMGGECEWVTVGVLEQMWAAAVLELLLGADRNWS